MTKRLKIMLSVGVLSALGIAGVIFFKTSDLDRLHAEIVIAHEGVDHIAASDFVKLEEDGHVLFDVREPKEFRVSHIAGAIQVSPDMDAEEFELRFADMLEDKKAIFYCSVGMRSSILAQRVADIVKRQTRNAPINLEGGLFKWSNENRRIVTANDAETRSVHPYNDYWGRLIEDRKAISYDPQS